MPHMNNMLGKRKQNYQKVDIDSDPNDVFFSNEELPKKRIFSPPCIWTSFLTTVIICIYFAPSIGLTFYQRWFYKSFKYPLVTVLVHMLVKLILAVILRNLIALKFGKQKLSLSWKDYVITVVPAGVFSGIDISFSNWGLELIRISMYTMTKSTTIIFILGFAILFKLERKSWTLVCIVVMIAFGLCLVTYKADEFNLLGFVLVLLASMSSGMRWTTVQILMQKSKVGMRNPIDIIYHTQGFMFLSVLPFMILIEGSSLIATLTNAKRDEISWMIMKIMVGALIAFFMEFTEVLVVSYTSSLTLSIAGIFKELLLLGLAVLDGDTFSTINVIGLVFCMSGIVIHVVHKISIIQSQARPYELDALDANDLDLSMSHLLLSEQEIEQLQGSSDVEEEQDSQEIFNILNRHER